MTVGTGATATSDSRWSERNIRYDLEGNILHLERYQGNANTPQATLGFSYDGPKRNGYSYDSNGNITYDPLRCFEIRYNLLNLAAEVIGHDPEDTAAAGTLLCETVYYADGTRAGVTTPDDGYWTTRYIGSLIYEGEPGQETLEGVSTDYGFIQWNGSAASSRMQYFLRDHLGSVRVIAEDRYTVISRTDYLPFGVRMSGDGLTGANSTARSSFFGFGGKENEMWGGYDTADGGITPHWLKGERYQHFGARAYDPVSCIFMQVDPMAEKYYGMTPYGYCAGNPIGVCDPQGDTLKFLDGSSIEAMINALPANANYNFSLENGKIKSFSSSSNLADLLLNDLSEIVSSEQMVEVCTNVSFTTFDSRVWTFDNAPYDYDDTNDLLNSGTNIKPLGLHIQGNTGQSLFPVNGAKRSPDSNIHIVINAKGQLNHRSVGFVHELGHVVLFLRGLPYKHGDPGVDSFIYNRARIVSKRLGYDN